MNLLAHLLVTVVLARLMGLSTGIEYFWAILFGVLIDFDHFLKVPLYIKENGLKIERYWSWRTPLQEPISFLWIIPVCLYFQTLIPIVFFSAHLVLDYLMSYQKQPFYPFSQFTIKKREYEIDDALGIVTVVFSSCILLFLV